MSRVLVALQFSLIAVLVARFDFRWPGPGALALLGAGIAMFGWALLANPPGNFNIRPEPKAGARLVTKGPYALVRHPMYLALMLAMGGIAMAGDMAQAIAWLALAGVLVAKAAREERGLAVVHPDYAEYRSRTRAVIPFLW